MNATKSVLKNPVVKQLANQAIKSNPLTANVAKMYRSNRKVVNSVAKVVTASAVTGSVFKTEKANAITRVSQDFVYATQDNTGSSKTGCFAIPVCPWDSTMPYNFTTNYPAHYWAPALSKAAASHEEYRVVRFRVSWTAPIPTSGTTSDMTIYMAAKENPVATRNMLDFYEFANTSNNIVGPAWVPDGTNRFLDFASTPEAKRWRPINMDVTLTSDSSDPTLEQKLLYYSGIMFVGFKTNSTSSIGYEWRISATFEFRSKRPDADVQFLAAGGVSTTSTTTDLAPTLYKLTPTSPNYLYNSTDNITSFPLQPGLSWITITHSQATSAGTTATTGVITIKDVGGNNVTTTRLICDQETMSAGSSGYQVNNTTTGAGSAGTATTNTCDVYTAQALFIARPGDYFEFGVDTNNTNVSNRVLTSVMYVPHIRGDKALKIYQIWNPTATRVPQW